MNLKNKKKLYLTVLGLSGTLSLAGCAKEYGNQLDNYEKNEIFNEYAGTTLLDYTQVYQHDDKVNLPYEVVYRFWVSFVSNTDDVYITINNDLNSDYDYFTGVRLLQYDNYLYNYEEPIYLAKFPISYFIEKYGFVKENYSDDDLRSLLEMIKNDYSINLKDGYNGSNPNAYQLVLKKERKK